MSDVKSRPRSHARWSRMFVEFAIYHFCGFWNFQDSENSRNLKALSVPVLPVTLARKRRAAHVFRTRFHAPNNTPMLHERSGPSLGKLKIRDLEILVILGIRDFPCHFHALPRQRMQVRKRGASRGRAGVWLEHVSAWPTMSALPHDRSGATLGKSVIFRFLKFRSEIWTVFALPCL